MKKLVFIVMLPLLMVACKKDLTSINVDPKAPLSYPSGAFFTSGEKSLSDVLQSTNVNTNIFRLITQYWQETTYTDESNFDLGTRQIPRQVWNALYRDVIRDFREAKKLIPTENFNGNPTVDEAIKKNQLAITEILEVYAWYYLVTTFGDVPYSEAMDADITQPKYDKQQEIYNDLLTRLDNAIADLSTSAGSFNGADQIYDGDVAAWKLFANSFKLKMGMTIADADNAKAKSVVESAVASGVFSSNADNAEFHYLVSPPNTNPVWVDLIQSNRKDFVAAKTIIDRMVALSDPRLPYYFSFDAAGDYSGGTPGASSPFAIYSKPSGILAQTVGDRTDIGTIAYPDFPGPLLSYSEVEFFLAEAKERGYNVPGTAEEHYNNAIIASIEWWGGTEAEAMDYLSQSGVAYNSANWKQLIGEQKWIALYNRGWDAWIEWRRLDYPQLVKPSTAQSEIPVRFTYPIPEQNLNNANYSAASSSIGGDQVTTKLFWDKY